ncbi:KAP family P-loop NTPase fold protein [Sphingomonas elodea]|uniref:KAP family P-loop NTPase fold protein n=1 Tax=Sphingomonas elodea TaxID=179878 RepID=UPI001300C058|nr:P-loop NTPase fold protein [Sphingomonas elodea]
MKIRRDLDESFFDNGFNDTNDVFQRGDLARRLTGLYENLEQGTVSILDGRWGTGKSVFARQWKFHLEARGVPCIYFDAFAADYIDSPFRAIATAFVREVQAVRSSEREFYEKFVSALSKAAKSIAAPTAKFAVKAVSFGLIGAAEIESAKEITDEIASGLGDISEASVKAMLEEQANDEANFRALQVSLEQLPSLLSKPVKGLEKDESETPLIIIIDELDRCRPDFALGILECLKHFFRARRLHFVLVTNVNHLLLSVQSRYGVGDAASEYIQKFYDFLIPFEVGGRSHGMSRTGHYAVNLLKELTGESRGEALEIFSEVGYIVSAYDLSIRQAEKIVITFILARIDFKKMNCALL